LYIVISIQRQHKGRQSISTVDKIKKLLKTVTKTKTTALTLCTLKDKTPQRKIVIKTKTATGRQRPVIKDYVERSYVTFKDRCHMPKH
jgi:hypothetical protein